VQIQKKKNRSQEMLGWDGKEERRRRWGGGCSRRRRKRRKKGDGQYETKVRGQKFSTFCPSMQGIHHTEHTNWKRMEQTLNKKPKGEQRDHPRVPGSSFLILP
jgi:hypothetical protein